MPPEVLQCLDDVSQQLREKLIGAPVRWVPVENIHLTLKFLGDVSESNIDMLTDFLQSIVSNGKQFEISVGGLGAYPKPHRPRVIWVGVEAPPDLMITQRSVESEISRLGYARERRPFNPHLTLGRVSRHSTNQDVRNIADVIKTHNVGYLGSARITAFHIYRSDLKPSGAVYTKLFSAMLSE
ncbi:MAG: RNA 2',3'-cyclic phosphodiesterase [Anaerolineales bacterium]|nr:RNA 2',3'-cyclic phosphodiesterase [Anaerolineales bacterium]